MDYKSWAVTKLKDNSLHEVIESFQISMDKVWYIDRHVIDISEKIPVFDGTDIVEATCYAGFQLLQNWDDTVKSLPDNKILVSRPILYIDQEWLDEDDNAPPPHVACTITNHVANLPHQPILVNSYQLTFKIPDVLQRFLLGTGVSSAYTKSPGDDAGCWLVWWN